MRKIQVCRGGHCRFRGSERIFEVLKQFFGANKSAVEVSYCLCTDNCDFGPNVIEDGKTIYRHAETKSIAEKIEKGNGEPYIHADLTTINLDEI